jgi:DNA modification methylase
LCSPKVRLPQSRDPKERCLYPEGVSTRPENNPYGYPRSIVEFAADTGEHPTQKPVRLLSYLIELFSRPGETVLDSCMGSGSTGVAALRTGRNFIGIEKHEPFFDVAQSRLDQELCFEAEAAD